MSMIDLTKKAKISLEKKGIVHEKAKIVLVLDISISMKHLFVKGTVQKVAERLLGIGMNMDDDRQIDVFLFGSKAHHVRPAAKETNIDGFVRREIQGKYQLEGSTLYAPVMKKVAKEVLNLEGVVSTEEKVTESGGLLGKLFGRKKKEVKTKETFSFDSDGRPVFVFFITDGDNFDKTETEKVIKEYATLPVFWQFVGVGNSNFAFLEKLDDMEGRFIDNGNFFHANDIDRISDEQLYDRLLNEYPLWLKEARSKGILQ